MILMLCDTQLAESISIMRNSNYNLSKTSKSGFQFILNDHTNHKNKFSFKHQLLLSV